jgi:hypothetical protein
MAEKSTVSTRAPAGDAGAVSARDQGGDPSPTVTGDDVARLAEALRAARRAHAASLAELRQADTEPVEDWAVWYAEYLLGVR